MIITVNVTRSAQWIAAQRIATGENVPAELAVDLDTAQCPPETRELLLNIGRGKYVSIPNGICFDGQHKPHNGKLHYSYGSVPVCVDSNNPTTDEICAAIGVACDIIAGKKQDAQQLENERNAQRERERAENERKAQELAHARELLAGELAKIAALKANVETLSDFLRNVPVDALRGAAKRIASEETNADAIIERVESASDYWLFSNRDEE